MVGARNLDFVPAGVDQLDLRANNLGSATALGVDHHQGRQTGNFVELLGNREALFDVLEMRLAGELGNDRSGQRVPVGQNGAGLDGLVYLDRQHRAIRNLVALALAAVFVMNDDFTRAGDHHQFLLAVGHITHGRVEPDAAVGLGFHARRDGGARCGAADVEGPHRQLGTRFTDRLRSDHADRLAAVDKAATAQVAPVALGANSKAGFAGQRGAHLHFIDADQFKLVNHILVEHRTSAHHHRAVLGMQHIFGSGAT